MRDQTWARLCDQVFAQKAIWHEVARQTREYFIAKETYPNRHCILICPDVAGIHTHGRNQVTGAPTVCLHLQMARIPSQELLRECGC